MAAIYGAELDGDLPDDKHNVAPTDSIRIVIERQGDRLLTAADWVSGPSGASRRKRLRRAGSMRRRRPPPKRCLWPIPLRAALHHPR